MCGEAGLCKLPLYLYLCPPLTNFIQSLSSQCYWGADETPFLGPGPASPLDSCHKLFTEHLQAPQTSSGQTKLLVCHLPFLTWHSRELGRRRGRSSPACLPARACSAGHQWLGLDPLHLFSIPLLSATPMQGAPAPNCSCVRSHGSVSLLSPHPGCLHFWHPLRQSTPSPVPHPHPMSITTEWLGAFFKNLAVSLPCVELSTKRSPPHWE